MKNTLAFTVLKTVTFAIVSLTATHSFASSQNDSKVIYGNDDRRDLYQITNPVYRTLAASTVALIESSNLTQNSSGILSIKSTSFMDLMGVCSTEPFADQPSGAFCSGTLIGKNLILTAGHCVTNTESCATTKFVFGYDVNQAGTYPKEAKETETYGCKTILHREQNGTGADFGIIELDRDVIGHTPLKLATHAAVIAKGTQLLMIGHPSGLPTKLDDGGIVRDETPSGFFVATTDSYGGNSGSAVFNISTQEIEGVLVRGENDFVEKGSCYVSNVCSATGCRGEDVTKASSILPFLPVTLL